MTNLFNQSGPFHHPPDRDIKGWWLLNEAGRGGVWEPRWAQRQLAALKILASTGPRSPCHVTLVSPSPTRLKRHTRWMRPAYSLKEFKCQKMSLEIVSLEKGSSKKRNLNKYYLKKVQLLVLVIPNFYDYANSSWLNLRQLWFNCCIPISLRSI